eukprot:1379411-Rhodomonas_salina.2
MATASDSLLLKTSASSSPRWAWNSKPAASCSASCSLKTTSWPMHCPSSPSTRFKRACLLRLVSSIHTSIAHTSADSSLPLTTSSISCLTLLDFHARAAHPKKDDASTWADTFISNLPSVLRRRTASTAIVRQSMRYRHFRDTKCLLFALRSVLTKCWYARDFIDHAMTASLSRFLQYLSAFLSALRCSRSVWH